MLSELSVSPSPHVSKPMSTRSIMIDVIVGLTPAMLAALVFFRIRAVVLILTCVIACLVTEWLCNLIRKRPHPGASLLDMSAPVTGVILALSLPPHLPWWAAVIGSAVSIAIGKMVFGGLGSNIFNPAMVGRTFLAASFGVLMTTWTVPATLEDSMPRIEPGAQSVDTRTQATPLAWSKEALKAENDQDRQGAIDAVDLQLSRLFVGEVGGCLGETGALWLLLGGVYLLVRKVISFHIPLAVLTGAFVFAVGTCWGKPGACILPWSHLFSGGLLLCALFIATDPVTAPLTRRGMWIFGLGIGLITMLIRVVGEYPEGVMYAVLLMNAVTPLIDRLCQRIPMGGKIGG